MMPTISIDEVYRLCKKVGAFMMAESKKLRSHHIETKDNNTLVSYVDLKSEEYLVEGLRSIYPKAGFITEEGTVAHQKETDIHWIIDPLDGTTNYLFQLPLYCINIALEVDGILTHGFTYHVQADNLYYAIKNTGAFKNKDRLYLKEISNFKEGLYATGFPKTFTFDLDAYLHIFRTFLIETRGIRRLGSAALDLAYVSEGFFTGFYERSLHPWDIAAGILIAQETGMTVTDFDGQQEMLSKGSIIAAPAPIHQEMLDIIRKNTNP